MRRRTPQRAREERAYLQLNRAWLAEHTDCERCGHASKAVHHRQGRLGALLLDVDTWMAVCNPCHRYVHDNPAESYEQGWMTRRVAA